MEKKGKGGGWDGFENLVRGLCCVAGEEDRCCDVATVAAVVGQQEGGGKKRTSGKNPQGPLSIFIRFLQKYFLLMR